MKLIAIGNSAFVNPEHIKFIFPYDSRPIIRMVDEAKERNKLFDITLGKKTRSVIVMDDKSMYLSVLLPDTIVKRIEKNEGEIDESIGE